MSAKQVFRMQLSCNGCGEAYPHLESPTAKLRERAAADGWKHRLIRVDGLTWPKSVDLCPSCVADAVVVERVVLREAVANTEGRSP